jgi:two-component system nitrogen regulation response regulator GlnG
LARGVRAGNTEGMDLALRQSVRDGDPVRTAIILRRAGRLEEALDLLRAAWGEGPPEQRGRAAEVLRGWLDEEEGVKRLAVARRLEPIASAGDALARAQLDAAFPSVKAIVGESPAMSALRSFVYAEASGDRPVVLWGEEGVGHSLAARTLHALSGRGEFHEAYGPRAPGLLRREIAAAPAAGGTLYVSYAWEGQAWEGPVLEACRRRGLRLVVGAVADEPPALLEGLDPAVHGIPPLRDRFEDLRPLLGALLERAGAPGAVAGIQAHHVARLRWHDWHSGNVRELANHVSRAVMSAEGDDDVAELVLQGLFGLPGEIAPDAWEESA